MQAIACTLSALMTKNTYQIQLAQSQRATASLISVLSPIHTTHTRRVTELNRGEYLGRVLSIASCQSSVRLPLTVRLQWDR